MYAIYINNSSLKCHIPHIYDQCAPVPIDVKDSATMIFDVEFEMCLCLLKKLVIGSKIGHASHTLTIPQVLYAPHLQFMCASAYRRRV